MTNPSLQARAPFPIRVFQLVARATYAFFALILGNIVGSVILNAISSGKQALDPSALKGLYIIQLARAYPPVALILTSVALLAIPGFVVERQLKASGVIPEEREHATEAARNRRIMLSIMRSFLNEQLRYSLHNKTRLDLNMEDRSDLLARTRHIFALPLDSAPQPIPRGTPLLQIFDESNERLLILGEPGGGKTTTLLALAQALLHRAEDDLDQPIPVVFNLSSWARERKSLPEWMTSEMRTMYQVPVAITRQWIVNGSILPLLDGLDEVSEHVREACVIAINNYDPRPDLLPPLVVSSRTQEFKELMHGLMIQKAIILEPLSEEQVWQYVNDGGQQLTGLKEALQEDDVLRRELARSPLMLSVMALAYQDTARSDVLTKGSLLERRKQLFARYVAVAMGPTRRVNSGRFFPYRAAQAQRWLTWMAHVLQHRGESRMYVDALQPSMAQIRWRMRLLNAGTVGLVYAAVGGLIYAALGSSISGVFGGFEFAFIGAVLFGAFGGLGNALTDFQADVRFSFLMFVGKGLCGGLAAGLVFLAISGSRLGLIYGLVGGLVFGLVFGITSTVGGSIADVVSGGQASLRRAISRGMVYGLVYAFVMLMLFGIVSELIETVSGGALPQLDANGVFGHDHVVDEELAVRIVFGLVGGVVFGLVIGTFTRVGGAFTDIKLYDQFSIRATIRKGWVVGLVCGVNAWLIYWLLNPQLSGLLQGLLFGLLGGLFALFVGGLVRGLTPSILQESTSLRANSRIGRTGRNGLIVFLVGSLIYVSAIGPSRGLGVGVLFEQKSILLVGLGGGFTYGLVFALIFGLGSIVVEYFRHYAVRLELAGEGAIPLRCVTFLEEASARYLVRPVGGGYEFIHRLLQEYFAELYAGELPLT